MILKDRYQQGDPITWVQVHNLIPFVAALIAVIGAFNVLSNRIELQAERLQFATSKTDACIAGLSSLQQKVEMQALDVKELQAQKSVRGASTGPQTYSSSTPQPGGTTK